MFKQFEMRLLGYFKYRSIVLLLFLQKQNLATAMYLFGLGTLLITTNLFYHHLSGTEETINYKKFRVWFRNDLLYIKSFEADKTINGFLHVHENRQD